MNKHNNVNQAYQISYAECEKMKDTQEVLIIREKLAELYESEQLWSKAAQMLSCIDLDSGMRVIDDTFRLSKCVQIACLYLEDDDAVNAEAFINKASFLVSNSRHEVLNLQYKVCYARILDLKRKFLEAALHYYDISQIEKLQIGDEYVLGINFLDGVKSRNLYLDVMVLHYGYFLHVSEIDEEALEQALAAAVTCMTLAAAGPQRSRVLATLYRDERCSKLMVYPILQKVYLESILRKPEIDAFAEELKLHQAEKIASSMIYEDRMRGSIDQVEAIIQFEDDSKDLQQWDHQIVGLCQALNDVLDSMAKKGLPIPV
ncbi:hypothetical protein ACH5RR_035123 [Cinchona calisaya]|uniref:COP9 signalosome complex subunit 4 n=1 Tax=Cinchona calisaya TaxID=153742 RepID=A0ABD2YFY1_9GENT